MVDLSTLLFVGVVVVIASNHLVMRLLVTAERPWGFWTFQAFNIVVGSSVIAFGIPGFSDYVVVQWMLGGLVLFHVILNNQARVEHLRQQRRDAMERELRESERLHATRASDAEE
ncbi:MAG: hypothetical protein EA397_14450 [Deltaproteobacteria bacterium]|nr:MAG: hypothetical protein EA397_14450 [Deltaproteobacteria bacterium]